jgi:hypothetical protein
MNRLCTASTLALALALAAPVYAEDAVDHNDGYWELALAGGMLMPLDKMTDVHQQSMAGSARTSWVSGLGVGFDLALDYSPLSRRDLGAGDVYEIHFTTAGLMPRFTLGKNTVRMWLAAGGGMAYEHSKHVATGGVALEPTSNRIAAAGMGAAGLELYAFSGVGLALIGSYTRTYGELEYQLLNVTGGLAVTFR